MYFKNTYLNDGNIFKIYLKVFSVFKRQPTENISNNVT